MWLNILKFQGVGVGLREIPSSLRIYGRTRRRRGTNSLRHWKHKRYKRQLRGAFLTNHFIPHRYFNRPLPRRHPRVRSLSLPLLSPLPPRNRAPYNRLGSASPADIYWRQAANINTGCYHETSREISRAHTEDDRYKSPRRKKPRYFRSDVYVSFLFGSRPFGGKPLLNYKFGRRGEIPVETSLFDFCSPGARPSHPTRYRGPSPPPRRR